MTLGQKVGQLLMISLPEASLGSQEIEYLTKLQPGSILFFKKNFSNAEQNRVLFQSIQNLLSKKTGIPAILTTDQESGRVHRLQHEMTRFPAPYLYSAADKEEITASIATITALELGAYGLNMNLAPVADVNNNPKNPVIGNRSFSNKSDKVSRHVISYLRSYQTAGIGATVKHFPGHGDTNIDSHKGLPVIQKSIIELEAIELPPFYKAAQNNVDAIMTAHILFPMLDSSLPATLSPSILQDLLRKKMNYRGVIISDDMIMGAIQNFSHKNRIKTHPVVLALQAGIDMVIYSGDISSTLNVFEIVIASIGKEITIEKIDKKVSRILGLKWDLYQQKPLLEQKIAMMQLKNRTQILRNSFLCGLIPKYADPSFVEKFSNSFIRPMKVNFISARSQDSHKSPLQYNANTNFLNLIQIWPGDEKHLNRFTSKIKQNELNTYTGFLLMNSEFSDYWSQKKVSQIITNQNNKISFALQSTGFEKKQLDSLIQDLAQDGQKFTAKILSNPQTPNTK